MMLLRLLLISVFCLTTTLVLADSIDIGFNNESFHLGYERPLVHDDYGVVAGNLGFLYNDDKRTTLGRVGVDFVGSPGQYPGLQFGIGSRVFAGSTSKSTDFINLSMGVRGSYAPPQLGGLGFAASAYHAPEIFSFRDSDRLTQAEVMTTYAVIPKVRLSLGYYNTRIKDDRNNRNRSIDNGLRVGFAGYF